MNVLGLRGAYRTISQFHENPRLVAWLSAQPWVIGFTAERRKVVLFFGAIIAGVAGVFSRGATWRDYRALTPWLEHGLAFLFLLGLLYALYLAVIHFKQLPVTVRRRPQIWFHLLFWLLLVCLWFFTERGGFAVAVLALILLSFPYLIWRAGYMLLSGQRGKAFNSRFRDHLFYIWPIWDGTNTPPGKGHDYLSRTQAQSPEAYARAILGGCKLLLLVAIWKICLELLGALIYGDPKSSFSALLRGYSLGLPRLKQILGARMLEISLLQVWLSLYLELIWETLSLAAKGHVWVGVIRLFGFNIFRNTYKPLLARTIVEFWNRYYYYFKELMMECFFLPTYARHFRQWPRLRVIAAVFAAAFVGNMYYHLLQHKEPLVLGDWNKLWSLLGARLVYCAMLAVGIAISMLRQQRQRSQVQAIVDGQPNRFFTLRAIAGVWTFFAVINFWNVTSHLTIAGRARLFFSLFGF
ncbi:MAG TPA: hypothetical protein VMZ02_00445 [Candidatus Limnocylindrales bacterium]|nr:hypothetical protein [Candidatus Limnocylindrales bacterium]